MAAPAQPADGPPRVPVPLRPFTLGDVLDGSFAVLKQRPGTILGFTAAVVLPVQLLAAYLSREQLDAFADFPTGFTTGSSLVGSGRPVTDFALMYLGLLPLPFVAAFLGRLVASWYGGSEPSTRELLDAVGRSTPTILATFVVVHLAETVAALVLFLPLLFLMPFFLLVGPIIGMEGGGPGPVLQRSWQLGARLYWKAFTVVVTTALLAGLLNLSFSLLPTLLALVVGSTWGWLIMALGNGAAAVITTPVVAGTAVLHLLDVRVRTEGLDLELRAIEEFGAPGG